MKDASCLRYGTVNDNVFLSLNNILKLAFLSFFYLSETLKLKLNL